MYKNRSEKSQRQIFTTIWYDEKNSHLKDRGLFANHLIRTNASFELSIWPPKSAKYREVVPETKTTQLRTKQRNKIKKLLSTKYQHETKWYNRNLQLNTKKTQIVKYHIPTYNAQHSNELNNGTLGQHITMKIILSRLRTLNRTGPGSFDDNY